MAGITGILHTQNDGLRVVRAVESLRACDEVLVVDHASSDDTCALAQRFGARVIQGGAAYAGPWPPESRHLRDAQHDWILLLRASESISEALEASLLDWKMEHHNERTCFGILIMEETTRGWVSRPVEGRLAHRLSGYWRASSPSSLQDGFTILEGTLMRMRIP